MSATRPKVSFITVAYRTPGLIRQLYKGIEACAFSFPFEVILVDNCVGDGTGDMIRREFPWVTYIAAPGNIGFGAGNNLGLRQATGEYVMFTNPDLTFFPGEMEKLLAFADAAPDCGLIGPRILNPDRTLQRSFYRFPSLLIPLFRRTWLGRTAYGQRAVQEYLMMDANPEVIQEVDGLLGAAILMRRSALEVVGAFDERYFMYFEDIDLCRRAWERGVRVVYAPVATFVHYHQRESRIQRPWHILTKRTTRIHIQSAIAYHWKYVRAPHPHPVARDVLTTFQAIST